MFKLFPNFGLRLPSDTLAHGNGTTHWKVYWNISKPPFFFHLFTLRIDSHRRFAQLAIELAMWDQAKTHGNLPDSPWGLSMEISPWPRQPRHGGAVGLAAVEVDLVPRRLADSGASPSSCWSYWLMSENPWRSHGEKTHLNSSFIDSHCHDSWWFIQWFMMIYDLSSGKISHFAMDINIVQEW